MKIKIQTHDAHGNVLPQTLVTNAQTGEMVEDVVDIRIHLAPGEEPSAILKFRNPIIEMQTTAEANSA